MLARICAVGMFAVTLAALGGCTTLKPWEKEHLLHPLMDDASLQSLNSPFRTAAAAKFEKLAGVSGSSQGGACPTCGG